MENNKMSQEVKEMPKIPLYWVSLLRILLGLLFLTTWWSNQSKGFYTPDGLLFFFREVFPQSQNSMGWYAALIEGVILPARGIFAPFQLVAEFLIGIFLLVGFLTPYTSAAAAFFILNTFLATFGHDWPWSYILILGILFVLFFTRAGRSLGVDARVVERLPNPPLPYLW